jgi:predicted dehydrogenase
MKFKNKPILIIGKSPIALRHYDILKKKYTNEIFFLDKKKNILKKNNNNYSIVKKLSNEFFFLVVICTPSIYHLGYVKKLCKKTDYLFVEKPFAHSFKLANNFFKNIKKEKKLNICIGYNLKFLASLIKFKELIQKKIFGEIFYVSCAVGKSLYLWRDSNINFAASKKKMGGGCLLELSHEIDYLLWIFGDLKFINRYFNPKKRLGFDSDENVFVNLETLSPNFRKIPINLAMDIIRRDFKRECEVVCEYGTIKIDLVTNLIYLKNEKKIIKLKFIKNDLNSSYKKQWHHYLSLKKFNTNNNLSSALKVLKLVDQIKND